MKKTKMLKKNFEFRKVLSKGKYYSGDNIEVFILKNNKSLNFIGLAISTKTGKAYIRNKIKRLIRENYKNLEKNLKDGYNIVFLWKKNKSTENAKYSTIEKDMKKIFDKANIIQENKEKI
ncbi:MAG: ribonuclease P protein component [Clostridia bacterium]|nr:ribonuclease P protein component [Clostridia bacterium]